MPSQSRMTPGRIDVVSGRVLTISTARLCLDKATQLLDQIVRAKYWNSISSGKRAAKKLRRRSKATRQQQQQPPPPPPPPPKWCDLQSIQGFQARLVDSGRHTTYHKRPSCMSAEATRPLATSRHTAAKPSGQGHRRHGRVVGTHGQAWEALGSNPPFAR
ncbi:hypothetical protein G6O67_005726 [Ophiocordyceps sinensis]|uniref:Uncharacterized protein n=2 Tax=Ophiocordyceps sinensis TaxID=72228 RepID=A0A8H4LY15_9HYPO|nr:hypothetical protein OCS_04163 [Ophiocordyceps sinensis CO18]KAF4507051.1 hypothetical protein G6O67_005726 [Ophiocordyceps sinensis]